MPASSSSRPRLVAALAATALAGPALAGCSSATATKPAATKPKSGPPAAGGTTVSIRNFKFSPDKLTVKVGTKVTWTNTDSAAHTATASDKSFDSKSLDQGKSYSFTFTKAGTYDYLCEIHQYMKATVTVS